jgi:hypothetical protein
MTREEAIEWIEGTRSMTNMVPQEPFSTWQERIAAADAAMMEQAYWVLKAHKEQLVPLPSYEGDRRGNGSRQSENNDRPDGNC